MCIRSSNEEFWGVESNTTWGKSPKPREEFFMVATSMVYTENPAFTVWRRSKMKRFCVLLVMGFFAFAPLRAQESVIAPAENLVVDGVPKIPGSLAESAGRYASFRSAGLA